MKQIAAAEFKAHCLRYLDEVDSDGILITKHGKPVARLMPAGLPSGDVLIGSMRGLLRVKEGDDLFSTYERWNAES